MLARATLLGFAALLCAPCLARAQSVIIMVTQADVPEGGAVLRAAAIEAVAERGVRLVRTPDGEPCEAAECAAELAGRAGADHVLLIGARSATEVELLAVPAQGEPVSIRQEVADGDFPSAVGAAVDRFLGDHRRTALGFLMVDTTPPGQPVRIDGEAAGASPLRRSVLPGEHRVRVGEGPDSRERTVQVTVGEETAVRVDLTRPIDASIAEPDPPPAGPRRTEPSPFNWVLGGALAVAGVLALISPLQTLAQDGQCTEEIENVGCLERVHIGPQTAVLLGIGIAALIAAVVVDAVAPIRVEVAVDAQGAAAFVEGRF